MQQVVRGLVLLLALLVPLHLPHAFPPTGEGAQLGWWSEPAEPGAAGPLVVSQTIWSARNAGLRPGDVLLTVDGLQATATLLERLSRTTEPGDTLTLTVDRGGTVLGLQVPVTTLTLSYVGYRWYRLVLALASWLIGIALVLRRWRQPATLALATALMLLPPVLFPIEVPPGNRILGAANTIWQIEAGAYRFFFPALILHFLTLPLRPLQPLRKPKIWALTYAVLALLLLLVTDGLRDPVAWASPGVPYALRSAGGLVTELVVLLAALYALRRAGGTRGPTRWLSFAAVFTFGLGVTVTVTNLTLPHAPLVAEGLRQLKSIMLLILIVMASLYTAVTWDDSETEWHFRGRLAATASALLTGLYAFAVAGAAAVIHSLEDRPDVMGALLFVGIFIATLAYSPVLRWARELVMDRQILDRWAESKRQVHEFIDRVSGELTLDRIAERIERELPALLDVPEARLVLARETASEWGLDRPTGLELRPAVELSVDGSPTVVNGVVRVPIPRPDGRVMAALEIRRQEDPDTEAALRTVHRTLAQGLASALRNAESHLKLRAKERELNEAERVAALGALAGGLAHEIKNPLAGLKMGIYLLEHADSRQDAGDKFDRIRREVRRIDDLVTGVFRLTNEGVEEPREALDVADVVQECIEEIGHQARDRRVKILAHLEAVDRPVIMGGHDQVRLIISNLLRNALEAVGEDGTVEVILETDGTDVLVLRVSDNGPGVPAAIQDHIFDLGYTTKTSGTGLGLALVRRELDLLGGDIELHSGPGGGTELRVLFPFANLASDGPVGP